MNRVPATVAVALAVMSPAASASVKPVGLLLGDASSAAVTAVHQMTFNGSPGTATATCTSVSWMAARCSWSVGVTSESGDRYSRCSGKLSIVRKQVKGYPLTATRVAHTAVTCVNAPFPSPGS